MSELLANSVRKTVNTLQLEDTKTKKLFITNLLASSESG